MPRKEVFVFTLNIHLGADIVSQQENALHETCKPEAFPSGFKSLTLSYCQYASSSFQINAQINLLKYEYQNLFHK